MQIDVVLSVSKRGFAQLPAAQLATLFDDVSPAPGHPAGPLTFQVSVAGRRAAVMKCAERCLRAHASHPLLVFSEGLLVDAGERGIPSGLTRELDELARRQQRPCSLVELRGREGADVAPVPPVRRVIATSSDVAELRAFVESEARALHLMARPPRRSPARRSPAHALELRTVASRDELRQALNLRHRVYAALGYLEPAVLAATSGIEMDWYDPTAHHFVIVDAAAEGRVVATMRLIMPGGNRTLPQFRRAGCSTNYERWCRELAQSESTPVFRSRLNNLLVGAAPILDSFDNFAQHPELKNRILPRQSCELSRVVVAPSHRGYGLSRRLVEHARSVVATVGRPHLLLECAPHHESLYERYGFRVVQVNGERLYASAQRLDQIAVPMHLEVPIGQRVEPAQGAAITLDGGDGWLATIIPGQRGRGELERFLGREANEALALGVGERAVAVRGGGAFRGRLLASLRQPSGDDVARCMHELWRFDPEALVEFVAPLGVRARFRRSQRSDVAAWVEQSGG